MVGGLSKSDVNMEWWKDQNVASDDAFKCKCDEVRTDGSHSESSSALDDGIATKREALVESKQLNGKSEELDGDEAYVVK
ncbi:hypothetical protein MTR67_000862 [Solanum verrucosum]|uniref:Uncharacterized protein n=1 Tax=Solanum verrucosum TaxID=315347 RepID=A0AAF0T4J4_SOLVR|nr:hypothetical protein MTR67_000862 [Solanum verrucosum]